MVERGFMQSVAANLAYWLAQERRVCITEHPNVVRAVAFGLNLSATYSQAVDLVVRCYSMVEHNGKAGEWIDLLADYVDATMLATVANCRLLNTLGLFYLSAGRSPSAQAVHRQSETLALALAETRLVADARYGLCLAHWAQRDYSPARAYGTLALQGYQSEADRLPRAQVINVLGMVAFSSGNTEQARQYFAQATGIFEALGEDLGLARSLNNQAMAASSLGEFEQALAWYGRAAALLAAQGSLTDLCQVEVSRGLLHYRLGYLDRAYAAFQRAIPAGWALSASQQQRAWLGHHANLPRIVQRRGVPHQIPRQLGQVESLVRCYCVLNSRNFRNPGVTTGGDQYSLCADGLIPHQQLVWINKTSPL